MATNLNDPRTISERGEQIYNSKYREQYEARHPGLFVAINIADESATLGKTATEALLTAKQEHPRGLFHLIRVGHAGAFEVGLAYRDVPTTGVHR